MQKRLFAALAGAAVATAAAVAQSPFIDRVYEYCPAPGQFINEMPPYEQGDDAESMRLKAQEQIAGERTPGMISLGAYGGYVVFGFDHPVVNVHGRYDFQVYGNAMPAPSHSAEPGIVSVSTDANGNGLPDDPWYELAGSDYRLPSTVHDGGVRYSRPQAGHVAVPDPSNKAIIDMEYIPYRLSGGADAGEEGWLHQVSFHTQDYWPQWLETGTLDFTGTRLAHNGTDTNGDGRLWVTEPLHWGYADNLPNNAYKGFSIDWAVDADGNPVNLERIDFVRVHTAILQNLGWIGEESTEICGGEDLHPEAVYSSSWPSDPIDPSAEYGSPDTGIGSVTAAPGTEGADIYDLQGRAILRGASISAIRTLPAGIYIERTAGSARKIRIR
ncbi:MAG: PKD domain-containing protein [Muribaculaceae bacterium]|nr:PKD domain-containing protein [Muribaculaceae bacterium]